MTDEEKPSRTIQCNFCLGTWELTGEKKFIVIEGRAGNICEHCLFISQQIVDDMKKKPPLTEEYVRLLIDQCADELNKEAERVVVALRTSNQ